MGAFLTTAFLAGDRKGQRLKLQAAIYRIEDLSRREPHRIKALWRNFWRLAEAEFGSLKLVADLLSELGYKPADAINMFFATGDSIDGLWSRFSAAGLSWRQVAYCLQLAKKHNGKLLSYQEQIDFIVKSNLPDDDKIGALALGGYLTGETIGQLLELKFSREAIICGLIATKSINRRIYRALCSLKFGGDNDFFCSEGYLLGLLRRCAISDEEKFCVLHNAGFTLPDIMKLFPTDNIKIGRVMEVFINCGVSCGNIALTYLLAVDQKANLVKLLGKPPFASVLTDDTMIFKTLDEYEFDREAFAREASQAGWSIKRIIKTLVDVGRTEDHIRGLIAIGQSLGQRAESIQQAYWTDARVKKWRQACDQFFLHDLGSDIDDLFGPTKAK